MKFFYRYRKATSLVSLTALVAGMAVAPAAAEYDPRTGRFLQRDRHGTGVVLQPSLPYHAARRFQHIIHPQRYRAEQSDITLAPIQ